MDLDELLSMNELNCDNCGTNLFINGTVDWKGKVPAQFCGDCYAEKEEELEEAEEDT